MSRENERRVSRLSSIKAGDVITLRSSKDARRWDVLAIDGMDLTIREHGTNYGTQSFPKDCAYDVVTTPAPRADT
jgi:hypothetical protein